MRGRSWISVTALFAICLLVLCGPITSSAADNSSIKIGSISTLSGANAPIGMEQRYGAEIAVAEINARGGVFGRKLDLVVRDDQSDPTKGIQAANELISNEKVIALIGSNATASALAIKQVAEKRHVVLITSESLGTSIDDPVSPFSFGIRPSSKMQAAKMIEYAVGKLGKTNIGLIHDNGPYGMDGNKWVLEELRKRKITPVSDQSYKMFDNDMTVQLTKLKEARAEALLLTSVAADAASIRRAAAQIGYFPVMIGPSSEASLAFVNIARELVDGFYVVNNVDSYNVAKAPRIDAFFKKYELLNKEFRYGFSTVGGGIVQSYDAIYVLVKAIETARSTDSTAVRNALEGITGFKGLSGTINFSKFNHEGLGPDVLHLFQYRNQKLALIE